MLLQHRLGLVNWSGETIGFLYLILNIQQLIDCSYALKEIMNHVKRVLLKGSAIELTPEMRRDLVDDLLQTEVNINNVMGNAIDAILVTSPAGLILTSNESFKKLVGYTEKELFNQPVTIVSPDIGTYPLAIGATVTIDEQYFVTMADVIDNLFRAGKVYRFRQYSYNKGGFLIPTEVNISVLRDRNGEITGFVRNIHDMSEKTRLEQELMEKEEKNVQIPEQTSVDDSTKTVLSIYINDVEKKLEIFDEILEKIQLLQQIINARFLYKKLYVPY